MGREAAKQADRLAWARKVRPTRLEFQRYREYMAEKETEEPKIALVDIDQDGIPNNIVATIPLKWIWRMVATGGGLVAVYLMGVV